jgi:hypothetical protein
MRVDPYGDCRTLQRRAYDHSRGCYYAVVETPDGREVVVTSRTALGPWREAAPFTIHPPARIEGM